MLTLLILRRQIDGLESAAAQGWQARRERACADRLEVSASLTCTSVVTVVKMALLERCPEEFRDPGGDQTRDNAPIRGGGQSSSEEVWWKCRSSQIYSGSVASSGPFGDAPTSYSARTRIVWWMRVHAEGCWMSLQRTDVRSSFIRRRGQLCGGMGARTGEGRHVVWGRGWV